MFSCKLALANRYSVFEVNNPHSDYDTIINLRRFANKYGFEGCSPAFCRISGSARNWSVFFTSAGKITGTPLPVCRKKKII